MINFAPFISLLLNKKRPSIKQEISEETKKEIKKIDKMGLFEAMDYVKNKE